MSTSTITDDFKRVLIDDVYEDFYDDATKYYIGIGRSQPWDFPDSDLSPPEPNPSALEVLDFKDNLQTLKRVSDVSRVAPRYNWTNGGIYSAWNNRFHSNNLFIAGQDEDDPFYVMTSTNAVYTCIKQGVDVFGQVANSTVPPSITDTNVKTFETSDGYQWKYLYTVGTNDTQKFLTSSYLPTEEVIEILDSAGNSNLDPFQQDQLAIQLAAVPGEIIGVEIDSAGRNFVDGTYELEFDGVPLMENGVEKTIVPARAWAKVLNNVLVDVTMREPSTGIWHFGENYYNATVRFKDPVSGDSYKLRPIIGPVKGLGAQAQIDLNSTALMYNVILSGTEAGSAIVDNDFRQVGLIRNPEILDSDGFGAITGQRVLDTEVTLVISSLKYDVNSVGVSLDLSKITGDEIIQGSNSNARAILVGVNVGEDLFYYTQNRETGHRDFELNEPITIGVSESTTVLGINKSDLVKQSGDVYYIDSRRPFMRNGEQSEDIKLVIDF